MISLATKSLSQIIWALVLLIKSVSTKVPYRVLHDTAANDRSTIKFHQRHLKVLLDHGVGALTRETFTHWSTLGDPLSSYKWFNSMHLSAEVSPNNDATMKSYLVGASPNNKTVYSFPTEVIEKNRKADFTLSESEIE